MVHSHTNAHTHRHAAATGETPEQKIERLEQELVDEKLAKRAWMAESRNTADMASVVEKTIRGYSPRNQDHNVAKFIADAKETFHTEESTDISTPYNLPSITRTSKR
jgi:hypothetical protein